MGSFYCGGRVTIETLENPHPRTGWDNVADLMATKRPIKASRFRLQEVTGVGCLDHIRLTNYSVIRCKGIVPTFIMLGKFGKRYLQTFVCT